ncbi:Ig-like domain-containing protein [Acidothermaceae bacterium B102]|nr:Ig-like domain-containing protein [Acidothermaceae bacterium B102]
MRRLAARLAATTLIGGVALSGATAAQAWTLGTQIGTATVDPVSGVDDLAPTIATSGACTDVNATNSQLVIYGSGFPTDGYNVSANNPNSIIPTNPAGGYDVPFIDTLANIALAQTPPVTYTGNYTVALVCKHSFGQIDYGDFITTLTFTDPHHYTSGAAAVVATTTTLTTSPATSAVAGAAVTLSAAVTPAGAAGSVQFLNGGVALGTAAVSGTTATLTTTTLAVGMHSLTAVFTPTAPAGATPSTSAAVSYAVNPPAPAITQPSAFVLPVGTKLTCPNGHIVPLPASEVGNAVYCGEGGAYVVVVKGVRPIALVAPSIVGSGKVGSTLTVKQGVWTLAYTSRTVIWLRDGKVTAIGGSYVVKKADKGHKISATVTVHLAGHADGSAGTAPVKTKALRTSLSSMANAVLNGVVGDSTPLGVPVGSVIGCAKGEFTGATTTTSGWLLDGKAYSADVAFVVPDALFGHQLVCRTTATGPGGTATSDAVATIGVGAKLLPYIAPKIAGTAKVGKKLTALAGKWYPVYAKATFVWLRNGVAIKGATKATYVLGKADKKHKISVRVSVTRTGWVTGKAVSAAVSVG